MSNIKIIGNDDYTEEYVNKGLKNDANEKANKVSDLEFDSEILREDENKRTNISKCFSMRDGTIREEIYFEPIHYFDESIGKYIPIDNTLIKNWADERKSCLQGFKTKSGQTGVEFGADAENGSICRIKKGIFEIGWKLLNQNRSGGHVLKSEGALSHDDKNDRARLRDMIRYNEVFQGIDLEYNVEPKRVKENIIVKSKQENYEYDFELTLANLEVQLSENQKCLEFYIRKLDNPTGERVKEVIFKIPEPLMFDASRKFSDKINYELVKESNSKYIFRIMADKSWIDQDERVFPVTIDPIVITDCVSNCVSKAVNLKETSDQHDVGLSAMTRLGIGHSHNHGWLRSYIKIDLPNLKNSEILHAELKMHQESFNGDNSTSAIKTFDVHKVISDWDENTPMLWNNCPSFSDKVYNRIGYQCLNNIYLSIDITQILKEWNNDKNNGIDSNFGILLKDTDENYTKYNSIFIDSERGFEGNSDYLPKIQIAYKDKKGIVSNKQHKNEVGRAGVGLIDLYTGNVSFMHNDVNIGGEKMPLSISHIFNRNNASFKSYDLTYLISTGDMGAGKGWKTNFHQYVLEYPQLTGISDESVPKYCYIDQSGNQVVLTRVKKDSSTYEILDETGKGLSYDADSHTLSDKNGNLLVFNAQGQLAKMEDAFGNRTTVNWANNRIQSVSDAGGHYAQFEYGNYASSGSGIEGITGELSCIKYAGNKRIRFEYDGLDRLIKIIYPDGTYSQYEYGTGAYQYDLAGVRDRTGYKIEYIYGINKITVKESTNVSKIKFDESKSAQVEHCAEIYRNEVEINFEDKKTYLESKFGKKLVHLFRNGGQAYCSYWEESQGTGENHIQVENGVEYYSEPKELQSMSDEKKTESFVITTNGGETNYIEDGSFESYTGCWIQNEAGGYCDGITSIVSADENQSYCLEGESNKVKIIKQTVSVPLGTESLIFSAFAKADSMSTSGRAKFRLSARVNYTDGSFDDKVFVDFNESERDWQYAALGIVKSQQNRMKNMMTVQVCAEYSNNEGMAYFDNFRLVTGKFVRQVVQQNVPSESTDGESTQNTDWTRVTIENGSGISQEQVIDEKGNIVKTILKENNNHLAVTEISYEKGQTKKVVENYRGIQTENDFDVYGNLVQSKTFNKNDSDHTNNLISQKVYGAQGNQLMYEYDERGGACRTHFTYDSEYNRMTQCTLPNGQQFGYSYDIDDNQIGVSTTISGDVLSNGVAYTLGLPTKITSENDKYLIEYNGFGEQTKITRNDVVIVEYERKNDSAYTTTDENTYNFVKRIYHTGNGNWYAEKGIVDKNGKLVCVKGITRKNGIAENTELLRIEYDSLGRESKMYDKGLGNNESIVYEPKYGSDGHVLKVVIGGSHGGELSETVDKAGRTISKKVKFGEERKYMYQYDQSKGGIALDNRIVGESINGYGTIGYDYDSLGRIARRAYRCVDECDKCSEVYLYHKVNNESRTTNYLCEIAYIGTQLEKNSNEQYSYDVNGNINSITEGGKVTSYNYDGVGRLIRENDEKSGKTRRYEYDKSGNIKIIRESDYTTTESFTNEVVITYSYSNGMSIGELTGVEKKRSSDNSSLSSYSISSYDNLGNPCNYKGNVLEWKRGRKLSRYGAVQFEYDARGIRRKKIANGTAVWYDVEGDLIHKETRGATKIWYYYDRTGIAGMEYNGERYYFQKSLQGDVKRILNTNGELIATYRYDAWGNHTVLDASGTENVDKKFIGNINPFRYRGYYYDVETKLYYLQSRYYDPEIGRFINADDVSYIKPEVINGLNLFAYCGNNPVMCVDPTGEAFLIFMISAMVGFSLSFGLSVATQAIFNGGEINWGSALIDGLFGAISNALWMIPGLNAIAIGFINGGLTAINNLITTGMENDWNYSWQDVVSIVFSSLLSGFISGSSRDKFLKLNPRKLLTKSHKFVKTVSKRMMTGYYNDGVHTFSNSYKSASRQMWGKIMKLNFGKGFYKDWVIAFLQSIASFSFSRGLNNLEW